MVFLAAMLAFLGAGALLLWPARVVWDGEGVLCRLLVGMAGAAVLSLILGSLSLTLAGGSLGVLAVGGVAVALIRGRALFAWDRAKESWRPLDVIACGGLALALGMVCLGAAAPVTGWDATVAHIALPSDYVREGRIYPHEGNVYSGYPHLVHSLLAVLFRMGGEGAVRAMGAAVAFMACAAVYFLGRRLGTWRDGLYAAAMFAAAPIFMDQATTVSVDLPFVTFATVALLAFLRWRDEGSAGWLAVCGLLAGASCGVRHTGYLVCLVLGLAVLWCGPRGRTFGSEENGSYRIYWAYILLAALMAAPWALRSALLVHNPVFPFLLSVFPSDVIDHLAISEVGGHETIGQTGGMSIWGAVWFPWDLVMHPGRYDGWAKSPGALVLVLGVPGLVFGGKRARWLGAYAGVGLACFYVFQRLARYVWPFLTPLYAVAALPLRAGTPMRRLSAAVMVFFLAYGLGLHFAAVHFKIPVALGLEDREHYLARRVERYHAFQYASEELRDGVLLTVDQRSYFIDGPAYQNHWALKRVARLPQTEQRAWLEERNIRYVLHPHNFVEASGALRDDVGPMLDAWAADTAHFEVIHEMAYPSERGGGTERVTFLRVRDR